jgi:hypothetical protein
MTPVQIFLSACAAALIVALGWLTDWGQGFSEPDIALITNPGKVDAPGVLPDFKLSSDSSAYAQIADRPLLNPTRRPAPTQPFAAIAPEEPKPRIRRGLYQLVGVVDMGDAKLAQIKESATNRIRSVKVGDSLQEMRVSVIDSAKVTLSFQGEMDVLELPKFTASGRSPTAPASPIPAQTSSIAPPPVVPPQPRIVSAEPVASPPVSSASDQPQIPAQRSSVEERRAARAAALLQQNSGAAEGTRPRPSGFGPAR